MTNSTLVCRPTGITCDLGDLLEHKTFLEGWKIKQLGHTFVIRMTDIDVIAKLDERLDFSDADNDVRFEAGGLVVTFIQGYNAPTNHLDCYVKGTREP